MEELLADLTGRYGADMLLRGSDAQARGSGWGSPEPCHAAAILRPNSTQQIGEILRLCSARKQTIVPHGGLTSVVRGVRTEPSDLALSLERMNEIEQLDEEGQTMTVQAGAILQRVQERARQAGLMFPMDLGARGSATIGGIISTNAGGNAVLRYGMTRNLVLGLEVVLADGTVLSNLCPVLKNNTGYDLKQFFIGAEGTLGVITRAVLRLVPLPASQTTALAAVKDFSQLPRLLKYVGARLGGTLSAFEVMWNDYYRLVTTPPARCAPALPLSYPYYALIEAMGSDQAGDQARFEAVLAEAQQQGLIADCAIALSPKERNALWEARDSVDQLHQHRPVFSFDISVPLKSMESYCADTVAALKRGWPDHKCFIFGHLGDSNLHVIIAVGSDDPAVRHRVESVVYEGLRSRLGSISAEHGIGVDKRPFLHWSRSLDEIRIMRSIKQLLDPHGILNPGKVLPDL
jgi:FAD/FMN-containing dehydrogenase